MHVSFYSALSLIAQLCPPGSTEPVLKSRDHTEQPGLKTWENVSSRYMFVHIKLYAGWKTAALCSPKYLNQYFKQCWFTDFFCRGGKNPTNMCRRWECGRRETNSCKQFHSSPRRYETGAMKQELGQFPLHKCFQITLVSLPDQKVRASLLHISWIQVLQWHCHLSYIPRLGFLQYLNFNLFHFPWKASRRTFQQPTLWERSGLLTPRAFAVQLHFT